MSFKIFLIWSSGSSRIRWSGTICAILKEGNSVNNFAILVEGIKRNNSVK